ncbi:MAG: polyprenyl synthetase family protein [Mariprofundus sp.]|nr:polyprenyl synthetase family protein [Mariprofundus sp.]
MEEALAEMLDARKSVVTERLLDAMRYSLLGGGKRIRPALLLECYAACGGKRPETAMPAALAIECIHTYSLIHDDLPCMDDDDLRRGNPTCHKQFDEATAVLAADALQTLAFELLASSARDTPLSGELIYKLAIAAGCQGMVGGQMLDMQADNSNDDMGILAVERIHLHKTGALLRWCCEAGAMLAEADNAQLNACSRYGKAVGLLFQVTDDILDVTASSSVLGKSAGKDAVQNKATYVSVLGLQRAREVAEEMQELAVAACEPLAKQGDHLRALVHYIQERGK